MDDDGPSHPQAGVGVRGGQQQALLLALRHPTHGDLLTRLPAGVPQLGAGQHPSGPPGKGQQAVRAPKGQRSSLQPTAWVGKRHRVHPFCGHRGLEAQSWKLPGWGVSRQPESWTRPPAISLLRGFHQEENQNQTSASGLQPPTSSGEELRPHRARQEAGTG